MWDPLDPHSRIGRPDQSGLRISVVRDGLKSWRRDPRDVVSSDLLGRALLPLSAACLTPNRGVKWPLFLRVFWGAVVMFKSWNIWKSISAPDWCWMQIKCAPWEQDASVSGLRRVLRCVQSQVQLPQMTEGGDTVKRGKMNVLALHNQRSGRDRRVKSPKHDFFFLHFLLIAV